VDLTGEAERRAAARTLFGEGLAHADAGRWSEAAERFERAYAVRPSHEIGYNLSTALIHLGRLVGASELLRRAADDTAAPPAVRNAARARLAQVTPRLARLTVQLRGAPEGYAYLDGRPLARAMLGVALPVDPGRHLVQARDPNGASLSRPIALEEGGESSVTLDVSGVLPGGEARPRGLAGLSRRPWFWAAIAGVAGAALAIPLLSR
jgi:hypothetical protein